MSCSGIPLVGNQFNMWSSIRKTTELGQNLDLSPFVWDKYCCLFLLHKNAMKTERDIISELCFEIIGRIIDRRIGVFLSTSTRDLFDDYGNESAEKVSDWPRGAQQIGGQIRTMGQISCLWLVCFHDIIYL